VRSTPFFVMFGMFVYVCHGRLSVSILQESYMVARSRAQVPLTLESSICLERVENSTLA
jgi:hypothetical protein